MSRINIDQLWSSATARLFGRKTTGAGQGEELSASDVKTILGVVTTIGSDDTTIPTSKAVNDAIVSAVAGLLDFRGSYDASTNLFPATGGSGIAGVILKGDFWMCSVAGTLGGIGVTAGDLIIALVDTPAQTSSNWDLIQHDVNNEYVTKALFDANTILGADSDNTPTARTIAEQQIVGRITSGNIKGLTATEVRTLINVADGANVGLPLTGGALSGALNEAKGTDIASGSTTDIGAATGNYVVVTGTTTITGLGTVQVGTRRIVNFSGALILTHHATALILPTGANITTVAGDTAEFISLGSGNWVCTSYQRKDGTALASASSGIPESSILRAVKTADETVNNSDTYQDDNELTVTLEANKTYILRCYLMLTTSAAAQFKCQFTYPASATMSAVAIRSQTNTTTAFLRTYSGTAGLAMTGYPDYTTNSIGNVVYEGVVITDATAGAFTLQWAQNTVSGNNTIVKKGSSLQLTKV